MVDLGAHLLRLVAPLQPGDALDSPDPEVRGWTLVGASTELGLRLSFAPAHAPTHPYLHVELVPATSPRRFAIATARLHLSYRSPSAARVPSAVGLRVCEAVAERVRANEGPVLDALAAAIDDEAATGPRIREVTVDRLLEPAGDPSAPFHTLSPYVGCLVGCRFCYAQSRLDPL
jgi:hypothetical protein